MRAVLVHVKFFAFALMALVVGVVAGSLSTSSSRKPNAESANEKAASAEHVHPMSTEQVNQGGTRSGSDEVVLFEPGQEREATVKELTSLGNVRTIAQDKNGAVVAKK